MSSSSPVAMPPSFVPSSAGNISTLAPTSSDLTTSQLIVSWVLFAVTMLVVFVAKYISRLVFSVVSGFEKQVVFARALKKHMELPLTLGLITGFLYLGCVILIPWSAPVAFIYIIVAAICRFFCWCAIWYACYCTLNLIVELLPLIFHLSNLDSSAKHGLVEGATILEYIIMFIISIVLLVSIPADYSTQTLTDILTLFTRINVVTGVLVAALAPIMRDLVAGLTMVIDRQLKVNDFVHVWGVAPPGRILEIRLRVTVIRVWPDDFVVYVPNSKFLRFPVIDYTTHQVHIQVKLPLALDTDPVKIREALRAFAASKQFGPVDIQPGMILIAELPMQGAASAGHDKDQATVVVPPTIHTVSKLRTELLLNVIEMCRAQGLKMRV